jgi:ribosome recycling factor
MASLAVPEPRLLVIQPWDKTAIEDIEKAILKSELGLTPINDGKVIRISIPPLTEERRKELVKVARKMSEENKVAIRNIRRDANEMLKDLKKEKEITEDDLYRSQDEVQKTTDQFISQVDELCAAKEKEILEI